GNICGGEPVMGKAIKSVWKYRGQSTLHLIIRVKARWMTLNAYALSERIMLCQEFAFSPGGLSRM
ncbi:hypothetical protein, partial [Klebsiella sp. FR21TRMT6331]|uniref:hypothetical protein n=1 Tax=Klebsiella sp. FR21TRMT6331 TaxID=3381299 RepID=UPI003A973E8B